ncbi:hypothetical protein M6B38_311110 [Iris pallida]|uniref:Uncharacterized protein n=1 Tax=Iris pallida TaxID=29817 RepID=A0AAX6HGC0_IRIPA|nr:hypothetical protein M6B38_311105 [Iris pallida]KAJ6839924.1 hypothetical protein M6B38_311110 [Iris pallida]
MKKKEVMKKKKTKKKKTRKKEVKRKAHLEAQAVARSVRQQVVEELEIQWLDKPDLIEIWFKTRGGS